MEFRIIDGNKIKEQRGTRSLREIAAAANKEFSYSAIYQWEKGDATPIDEHVPILLEALGCGFEDISTPASKAVKKADA